MNLKAQTQPIAPQQKRRGFSWRPLVIFVVGVLSIVPFALISLTVNGQPSTRQFDGWIAVLQPTDAPMNDQVGLYVSPVVPGAPGAHPALDYTVAACGPHPFSGALLIGGNARLSDLSQVELAGPHSVQSPIHNLPDLEIGDEATDQILNLGSAQLVDLAFPTAIPCYSTPGSSSSSVSGVAQEFTGYADASVQNRWALAWWGSPRQSQEWPLLGEFPGTDTHDLGGFEDITGLTGSWSRPLQESLSVSVGSLTDETSVDIALPASTDPLGLGWTMWAPFQPSAQLTDTNAMARWQEMLVYAGIALGLGGGLLASLLFEWLRNEPESGKPEPPSSAAPPDPPVEPPRPTRAPTDAQFPGSATSRMIATPATSRMIAAGVVGAAVAAWLARPRRRREPR